MQDAMTAHVFSPVAPIPRHVIMMHPQLAMTVHAFFLTAALMLPLATSAQIRFATMALAPIPVALMQLPLTTTSTQVAMMNHAFTPVWEVARMLQLATTTQMQRSIISRVCIQAALMPLLATSIQAQAVTMALALLKVARPLTLATTTQQRVAMMVLAPSPVAPTQQPSISIAQQVVMTALAPTTALKVVQM